MKFKETNFDEYIQSNKIHNLHPKLSSIYNKLPEENGKCSKFNYLWAKWNGEIYSIIMFNKEI